MKKTLVVLLFLAAATLAGCGGGNGDNGGMIRAIKAKYPVRYWVVRNAHSHSFQWYTVIPSIKC